LRRTGFPSSAPCFLILFLSAVALPAQETTASLRVAMSDPTGASVRAAVVSATHQSTGLRHNAVSSDTGDALFPILPVGAYTITASAPGFAVTQLPVRLSVNQELVLPVELRLSDRQEVVEVRAEAVEVNVTRGASGQVMNDVSIRQLPLNGRNFLELATLQAGVLPRGPTVSESTPSLPGQQTFSANGLRPQSNNFLLDGADNNDAVLGSASAVPSPDALEEFRILINAHSAEYGRGGGAMVNILTRGGGNQFRGSAYNYLRNDAFDARNFFAPALSNLTQNQFGATFGGPLRRDRTFFFTSYEGFRRKQGVTATSTVISSLERQGDYSQSPTRPRDPSTSQPFPGGLIPASRLSPISQGILALIPQPNAGRNQLIAVRDGIQDNDQFMLRGDHWFSSNHNLTARYFRHAGEGIKPFSSPPPVNIPGFPYTDRFTVHNALLGATVALRPTLLSESRLSYSRADTLNNSPAFRYDPAALGFRFPVLGEPNLPSILMTGFTNFGTSWSADPLRRDNNLQAQSHLTWIRGRHRIKTGVDFFFNRFSNREDSRASGDFSFNGSASGISTSDFVLGLPFRFLQGSRGEAGYFRSNLYQFYVQDDIRLTRRITLNLGLRYELNTAPREEQERIVAFRPGVQSTRLPSAPAGLLLQGDPGVDQVVRTTKTNFGPRVGFAWDLLGNGTASLRGGYGLYFDPLLGVIFTNTVVNTPFTASAAGTTPRNFADPFSGQSPFRPGAPAVFFPALLSLTTVDPDYRTPHSQQWNLTFEKLLPGSIVATAGYVGTKGTHLPGSRTLNAAEFRPGATAQNLDQRRPFAPAFGAILDFHSQWNSIFHSAQFSATRRWSKGFTFLGAYTFSKAIDQGSFPTARLAGRIGTAPQNANDFRSERGLANFDQRHRFTLSNTWDLPWRSASTSLASRILGGWQLSTILILAAGQPFIILDGTDPNLDGVLDRPDLIRNPNLPKSERILDRYWDTAAFARVPAGTNRFGNAGRNVVTGPSLANLDAALGKRVAVTESLGLELRWEVFNVTNHPNFANPGGGSPTNDVSSPLFGRIQATIPNNERVMQFSLRIQF
jgi:hypothetical protein